MLNNEMIFRFIAIFCIILLPLTNIIAANHIELKRSSYEIILEPFVILVSLGVIINLFLLALDYFNAKLARYTFLLLIPSLFFFFYFRFFLESLMSIFTIEHVTIILLIITLLIIIITFLLYRKEIYLNILKFTTITMFTLSFFSGVFNYFDFEIKSTQKKLIQEISKKHTSNFELPNVYYIIADGLTGPINYKRLTNESFSFFSETMRKLNFQQVNNSRSNYISSASSIGSIFHLNYFRDEYSNKKNPEPEDYFPHIFFEEGRSFTLNKLKNMGMKISFFGSWYADCKDKHIECFEKEFNFNRMSLRILDNSFLSYLSNGFIGKEFPVLFRRKLDALTPLKNHLINQKTILNNRFIFIHHMQPHDPWYFDKNCKHIITKGISKSILYSNSVHCIKKNIIELMNVINKKDPDALVVLHGDHGWHFKNHGAEYLWTEKNIFYRTEISSFLKLPKKCSEWIIEGMGPINIMKLVLGCLERKKPTYLEEFLFMPSKDYSKSHRLFKRNPVQINID